MTESQIIGQSNLYMALMDLKQDIERIKYQNKKVHEQIQKCEKLSSKTYRDMDEKFQEVVKLSTNSFIQVTNQNDLLKKQNQIHQNLTQSNSDLVRNINMENLRLNEIFFEQKIVIDRITQANQVVVNEELTKICKKQEQMIRDQIIEYNKQNQFIEQQKAKISLSFEAVANFEQRNLTLQQKLLKQKDEIQKYIVQATKQNQSLVIDLIYKKYEQAQNNFNNNVKSIQKMRDQFDSNKNSSLKEINQIIRRSQNNFGNLRNQIQGFKNECYSMKNQCEHFCNEQKNHLNRTRQQLQKIEQQRKKIEKKCSEIEQQMQKLKREQRQNLRNIQSKIESKLQQLQRKIDRLNNEIKGKVQQQIRKHTHKIKKQIEQVQSTCMNKICTMEKKFNIIESKVDELKNK